MCLGYKKNMNILMVGDAAFAGENLVKGLKQRGHTVFHVQVFSWFDIFHKKYDGFCFDVVHIHIPNFKKLLMVWRYVFRYLFFRDKHVKIVCHWHGSDLRHPLKTFPVYRFFQRFGDFHLYSTLDLRWWLKWVSEDRKMLFTCPVDTMLFKSDGGVKEGNVVFRGGGKSFKDHRIPHDKMSGYLNRFSVVDVFNADGLDDGLLSVVAMEAVCCGCRVNQLPGLTRQWVVDNASIDVQTEKLLSVYGKVLNG